MRMNALFSLSEPSTHRRTRGRLAALALLAVSASAALALGAAPLPAAAAGKCPSAVPDAPGAPSDTAPGG